ncbi:hypothetical protein GCM10007170_19640 [Arthrobacter liuii]|uniref:Uncharacterized protein n=1 Tax=Arthrobacter liuii TaxID=1476996 RepID=A0ABQ2APC9_9MICC|nr:hypothetical protein GCM10007170_19640 [Arthrobacter liuii]
MTGENTRNSRGGPGLCRDPPGGLADRHAGRRHQHRRIQYDGDRHHGFDGDRFVRHRFVRVGYHGDGNIRFLQHVGHLWHLGLHRILKLLRVLKLFRVHGDLCLRHL